MAVISLFSLQGVAGCEEGVFEVLVNMEYLEVGGDGLKSEY